MTFKLLFLIVLFSLFGCVTTLEPSPSLKTKEISEQERPSLSPNEVVGEIKSPKDQIYEKFTESVNEGDKEKVENLADQLLMENPDDPVALNGLAHVYRKSGQPKLAEILVKRVLAKDPKNLRARQNLAMIYAFRNEKGKALQEFHLIHQQDTKFPGVAWNIASIYLDSGVYSAAEEFLRQVVAENPSLVSMAAYGQALVGIENYDEALLVFIKEIRTKGLVELESQTAGRSILDGYLKILELEPSFIARERPTVQNIADTLAMDFSVRARKLLNEKESTL